MGSQQSSGSAWCAEQYDVLLLEMAQHGRETAIVQHDVAAIVIAQRHADVLPDLDADRSERDCGVDLPDGVLRPIGILEVLHREGPRKCHPAGIAQLQRDRISLLIGQRRKIGVVDIDRQNAEMIARRLRHEAPRGAVDMHVRVDLLDASEVGKRVVALAGVCGRGGVGLPCQPQQQQRQQRAHAVRPAARRHRDAATLRLQQRARPGR